MTKLFIAALATILLAQVLGCGPEGGDEPGKNGEDPEENGSGDENGLEEPDPALEAIVLQRRLGGGELALVLVSVDTGEEVELLRGPVSNPVISPCGERLVFLRAVDDTMDIHAMDLFDLESEEPLLADPEDFMFAPSFSPDGGRIAFSRGPSGGPFELWIMARDGASPEPLTSAGGRNMAPAFSPDGTRIVFSSDRSGQSNLYLINVDGTGLERLTDIVDQNEHAPVFSPEGEWIAFSRRKQNPFGFSDLFMLNLEDGEEIRLTDRPGADDFGMAITPTGRMVFSSDLESPLDAFRLYTLEEDGTEEALTAGPWDQSPAAAYGPFFAD